MSSITASSNFTNVKPEELAKYVDLFGQDVTTTINGQLDFATNFNAKEITVVFASSNTDTATGHTLGRIPVRYIVTSATTAMSVYNGATASTSSTIYLKSSATGTATILIY